MSIRHFKPLLAAALLACLFGTARAGSVGAEGLHTTATLISEVSSIQPGTPFWVAVRLQMKEGWHTYWKYPGESGLPTKIQWNLPPGFAAGPIKWPAPRRIQLSGQVIYGYEHEVWLLTKITPDKTIRGQAPLKAHVTWLECADVCIPGKSDLEMKLPVSKSATIDSRHSDDFQKARARLPETADAWDVKSTSGGKTFRILMSYVAAKRINWDSYEKPQFFPDASMVVDESVPQKTSQEGAVRVIEAAISPDRAAAPDRVSGLVLFQGAEPPRGVSIDVPVTSVAAAAPSIGFLASLLLAFVGGLILNLMPCVLPVLSLKILGFVNHSQGDPATVRRLGWMFSAGVVVSFWALAILLLILKAGGSAAGWGFQMQSPVFVGFLVVLFTALGFNLWGTFEIGTSLIGLGRWISAPSSSTSAFANGVLAVVVATPCTAPFMGAALGYALTQPAPAVLAIFTSLGAGMALPYVGLSYSPRLLKILPKPGPWMGILKKIMAVFMFATVAWLIWVLKQQIEPAKAAADGAWEPYSAERVQELEAAQTPYFIDFTAAWCLTCQVNERTSLSKDAVMKKFEEKGVRLLKGDWTSHDDKITQALAAYGRNGVPVYVLAGRDGKKKLLPEILTPDIVLKALDEL